MRSLQVFRNTYAHTAPPPHHKQKIKRQFDQFTLKIGQKSVPRGMTEKQGGRQVSRIRTRTVYFGGQLNLIIQAFSSTQTILPLERREPGSTHKEEVVSIKTPCTYTTPLKQNKKE